MKPLRHNDLVIDVPDGWTDGTVLTLVGPPPTPTTPLSPKAPRTEPPTIVVKDVPRSEWDGDRDGFVRVQDELMSFGLVDSEVTDNKTLEIDGAEDALVREYRFGPQEDRLRQVLYYVLRGESLFVVCGTASDDLNFSSVRKATERVAIAIAGA